MRVHRTKWKLFNLRNAFTNGWGSKPGTRKSPDGIKEQVLKNTWMEIFNMSNHQQNLYYKTMTIADTYRISINTITLPLMAAKSR